MRRPINKIASAKAKRPAEPGRFELIQQPPDQMGQLRFSVKTKVRRIDCTRSAAMKCKDRPKIKSAGNGYSVKFDSQVLTVSPSFSNAPCHRAGVQ